MKRKNKSQELVTKDYLKSELQQALDVLEKRVDQKAQGYRDEILTKLDGVMGEFEAIREDRELAVHQTSEMRQQVDNHEKRISALEKS